MLKAQLFNKVLKVLVPLVERRLVERVSAFGMNTFMLSSNAIENPIITVVSNATMIMYDNKIIKQ